jgi:hypothetical protein
MSMSPSVAVALFVLLDVLTVGVGMGVPFFTILLGFPVGGLAARRRLSLPLPEALVACFHVALRTSAFSLIVLGVIWLPWLPTAWGPEAELAKTGVPLILYEPRASFIGWMALMLVISPLAQVLTTLAGSYVTLMRGGGGAASDRTQHKS